MTTAALVPPPGVTIHEPGAVVPLAEGEARNMASLGAQSSGLRRAATGLNSPAEWPPDLRVRQFPTPVGVA